ncbi:MAG: hypothetical protein HY937_08465 [Nitrosomonadales bacterium]|nr:hypothetical protein [Nitrosomonadales bacterium]
MKKSKSSLSASIVPAIATLSTSMKEWIWDWHRSGWLGVLRVFSRGVNMSGADKSLEQWALNAMTDRLVTLTPVFEQMEAVFS